ncbi:FO synthase [Desulfosporosinus sp. HMP52]|uniref:FO synthase n=1 Tax=Desulfosporosinus sp. HMP52 TaxID=1487923 RepID=UPI00051F8A28|nr:FO synthase [Desulfosporosinus sp. HMP52]KGK91737.1 FO synthase [Desulfosporosinus sp. HMP52]
MPSLFALSELKDLVDKIENGQRLDLDDGVRLLKSQEILTLGYMANLVREQKNGNKTYYKVNRPINFADIGGSLTEKERFSTALMSYGNPISPEEFIDSLIRLRNQQDQTKQFSTFSPVPYYAKEQQVEGSMGAGNTTGNEDLKMLAISRILLDNFSHVRAYWMLLGQKLAQVSLAFGVDDLDGTVMEEQSTPLIHLIQKAGREAVERD